MKREFLTDEQVEAEISRLSKSEDVKLAKQETRIKNRCFSGVKMMQKNKAVVCWDSPCDFGKPICCLYCEAFHGCIQSCDQTDCETWKEFEQDDEESDC